MELINRLLNMLAKFANFLIGMVILIVGALFTIGIPAQLFAAFNDGIVLKLTLLVILIGLIWLAIRLYINIRDRDNIP